ncbi:hypothetical protein OBBRIDRAFT_810597 [Obba rivulosa]|uniref:Uncharacterized protein n=1 Tax=Obba rivulosa TaxID=1052685 RepID=A0A8E2DRE2_9APHY|nr:hypothetical protein OBBRIDRAFT_810597 [Obba rivulosa]
MAANTVAFPTSSRRASPRLSFSHNRSLSNLSITNRASALEVCDLVYCPSPPTWEAVERFYEDNAVYENPFLTASSRTVIKDIHTLANQLSNVDVPKPTAVLYYLLGLKGRDSGGSAWFRAVNVRNEITDVCESDSFDGHCRIVVEHTLHILLLPDLYSAPAAISSARLSGYTASESQVAWPATPAFRDGPWLSGAQPEAAFKLQPPSPLHLCLPVITRLTFNDGGKITHHRDFWDVKDLLSLIPGMSLAQWISTRVVAQGIRGIVGASRILFNAHRTIVSRGQAHAYDGEEHGLSAAGAQGKRP